MSCEYCRQHPHHPSCPNAPEPKVRGHCEQCGEPLREDYEYCTDNQDDRFCSYECATDYHGIESKFWSEEE